MHLLVNIRRWLSTACLQAFVLVSLAACGSSGGDSPPAATAPTVTTQPVPVALVATQQATFSVVAAGTAPLSYQWKRDGVDISGATSASYTFTTSVADSGKRFSVVVSNSAGSITSDAALLTVNPLVAVAITTQPATITVQVGQAANFNVQATGTAPLAYQWQREGVAISGATAATYSLASATLADSGATFRVLVTNSAGTATSDAATLTVLPAVVAPVITSAPQAQSVREGSTAIFSVAASGTAPFAYRWFKNGAVIPGAAAANYTTPALAFADATALWTVEVSNSAGAVTSAGVQVAVTAVPPAITTQPQALGVTAGQTATFSVSATGSAPLTYQWRRNGAAIAGATAATYTTPATVLADDGALLSVVVNNAANVPATSANAQLAVAAAAVAPSFTTAPAGLTVTEGQRVTFNAAASGTAPIAYQWRRNGSDIAGASNATYVIAAATLADNGARFSVRANNAAGQVTSTEVMLTVNAATSVLAGRAWTASQLLESNDQPVIARAQGIDDQGRATVVFLKSDGTRNVLYATRGTPGAAPAAPSWSTLQVIDLQGTALTNNMSSSNYQFDVQVAPGGNAVAHWFATADCSATTYQTTGTCRYLFIARYLAASNTWEQPVLVGDMPSGGTGVGINDRGDVYGILPGWVRSGTASYDAYPAVFWRANGSTSFTRRTFSDVALTGNPVVSMDNSGNLLVVSQAAQGGTTDIVAYRGTLAGGFGTQQVLDTRGASATLQAVSHGVNGQQVVVWSQNNGTETSLFAATASGPTTAWTTEELGSAGAFFLSGMRLTVDDTGNAVLMHRTNLWRKRWAAGAWQPYESLPAGTPDSSFLACSHARSGDFLCVANNALGIDGDSSMWVTYDATRNVLIQPRNTTSPGSGFVIGLNAINGGLGLSAPLLSVNGVGMLTMQNKFDVLPTSAAPAGDGRNVTNLWGAFMR